LSGSEFNVQGEKIRQPVSKGTCHDQVINLFHSMGYDGYARS